MEVICVGGPCHGLVIDLPKEQDIYRPTGELRPRYAKLFESPRSTQAYFAYSDLTSLEANQLVMEHIRSRQSFRVASAA